MFLTHAKSRRHSKSPKTLVALCITALMVTAVPAALAQKSQPAPHRLAIQVDENNPATMTLALNNAQNVIEYYAAKHEPVDVRIVTFGPGLHMLRADTSPVKARIAEMSLAHANLHFAACENTRARMAAAEHKDIPLIAEGEKVPSGVVTLMELEAKGYAYIRP